LESLPENGIGSYLFELRPPKWLDGGIQGNLNASLRILPKRIVTHQRARRLMYLDRLEIPDYSFSKEIQHVHIGNSRSLADRSSVGIIDYGDFFGNLCEDEQADRPGPSTHNEHNGHVRR
jgi:hypothetical protein